MNRLGTLGSVAFFALVAATPACDVELGSRTKGDAGVLSFELRGDKSCWFGCSADRAALAGSTFTLGVSGVRDARYDARTSMPDVATVTRVDLSCNVDRKDDCSLLLTVSSKKPGTPKIEILSDGAVVDSTSMRFVDADRVETVLDEEVDGKQVEVPRAADGAWELPVGKSFELGATVFAGDAPLVVGSGALTFKSRDEEVASLAQVGTWDADYPNGAKLNTRREGGVEMSIGVLDKLRTNLRIRVR